MMVMVLVGGILGFWAALIGLLLGLPPLAALAIWAGSGPAGAMFAIGLAAMQGRSRSVGRAAHRPAHLARHA